jgi:hypothetical protein
MGRKEKRGIGEPDDRVSQAMRFQAAMRTGVRQ